MSRDTSFRARTSSILRVKDIAVAWPLSASSVAALAKVSSRGESSEVKWRRSCSPKLWTGRQADEHRLPLYEISSTSHCHVTNFVSRRLHHDFSPD